MLRLFKELREWILEEKINMVLLFLVSFPCIFFFFYSDQTDTASQSVFYIESILKGNLIGAYQDYIDVVYSTIPHGVDIPMVYTALSYLVVGVLSLPLVIIHMTRGLNFHGHFFFLYIKAEQVFLVVLCAYVIYKICKELDLSSRISRLATLLFLSSCYILYFALVIGQMEIYVAFFSLLGILFWLQGKKWRFLLCFAIAIPIKMFALLIFIPLIIIKEKNIWKIFGYTFLGSTLFLLEKIIYGSNEAYRISTVEPNLRMINAVVSTQISGAFTGIPIFILLYTILCVFIYIRKDEDKIWGIYYSFVIYSLVFIFVGHYPYWIVILAPFIPILLVYNQKKTELLMIVDILTMLSYMFCAIFYHSWSSNVGIVIRMFLPQIIGERNRDEMKYIYTADWLKTLGMEKYMPVFVAVYVAGMISMCVLANPKLKFEIKEIGINYKLLTFIRTLIILPLLGCMLYCYVSVKPEKLIDTTVETNLEEASWDLLSNDTFQFGDDALSQKVKFLQDGKVNRLKLYFTRIGNVYAVSGSVIVTVRDVTENENLIEKRIGYNELTYGDFTDINIEGISVLANHEYEINISCDKPQNQYVHIMVTQENNLETSLMYLGQESDRDLYMIIEGEYN